MSEARERLRGLAGAVAYDTHELEDLTTEVLVSRLHNARWRLDHSDNQTDRARAYFTMTVLTLVLADRLGYRV